MIMKIRLISLFVLILLTAPVFAQKENKLLRKGNSDYDKGNFNEAEKDYRKALEINKESIKGKFNLGAAVYKEKNFEESAKLYDELAGKNQDREIQAQIYHNLGNSLLEAKQYDKSILAYKNSLMNNPSDIDTKYNLEYARMMLKKQQQQQQKKDQNKKDQDKKDQKKDQDKKDQNKQDQKNQPPQDQKKLSKEDAQRMLEALKNDEKKTMQKVKKEKAKVQVTGIEKDW
jgi:Ca-activated chloride channel homolog